MSCSFSGSLPYFYFTLCNFCILCSVLAWKINMMMMITMFNDACLCSAGVVVCLERGADLHTTQLMPLPLTVSCCSKISIGFTFLVPAHPGSPGQRAC